MAHLGRTVAHAIRQITTERFIHLKCARCRHDSAATAIANDLPLFTCNPSDFENINELDLKR